MRCTLDPQPYPSCPPSSLLHFSAQHFERGGIITTVMSLYEEWRFFIAFLSSCSCSCISSALLQQNLCYVAIKKVNDSPHLLLLPPLTHRSPPPTPTRPPVAYHHHPHGAWSFR